MRRRDVLRAGAAGIVGAALAGCLAPRAGGFDEGFEAGIGDWETDAAIGPEVDVADFEWTIDVSGEEAYTGERSLRIANGGDYDDGVSWAVHPIPVDPGRAYTATATAQFWSESESFNTLRDAVFRLGPDAPETEEEFPNPGVNTTQLGETPYGGLREPLWLTDGWREYAFEWTTPVLETDTLYVALGTSVIWEGDATHYVDDVSVTLQPR